MLNKKKTYKYIQIPNELLIRTYIHLPSNFSNSPIIYLMWFDNEDPSFMLCIAKF